MNSPTTPTRERKRVPWYATTPRDSRIPLWYVWCAILCFISIGITIVTGASPAALILPSVLLVLSLLAWRR